LGKDGIIGDDLRQKESLYRSVGDDDFSDIVGPGEASQIRNGCRRKIHFGLIVGGESGTDLELDNARRSTEELDEVQVEGERGREGCNIF